MVSTVTQAPNDLTFGWDFVYAENFLDINAEIVSAKSTPTIFSTDNGREPSDPLYRAISGNFADAAHTKGDWKLTTGGASRDVWMEMPDIDFQFTKGTASPVSYINCTLRVSFNLAFRDTGNKASNGGRLLQLKIQAQDTKAANQDLVTIEHYESTPSPTAIDEGNIRNLFSKWFEENMDQFDHVFAEVVVDGFAEHERFQWLQPTGVDYSVNDTEEGAALDTGFITINVMTENRNVPGAITPPSAVLPGDKRRSFVVSPERFLDKFILPGMGHMFSGPEVEQTGMQWPEDYFDIIGGTVITNNADLKLNSLEYGNEDDDETEKSPVRATIEANRFTVTLAKQFLIVEFVDLKHPYITEGIEYLDTFHTFRALVTARLNPENQFDLVPTEDPDNKEVAFHKANVEKTTAAQVVEWLLVLADVLIILKGISAVARGWLAVEEAEAEVGEEAAEQAATATEEGAVDEGAQENIDAAGGAGAEAAANGTWSLRTFFETYGTIIKGTAAAIMTPTLIAEQVYQYYANKNAKEKLPKFQEFADEVLEPVTWTTTPGGFDVNDARFNDGFQAFQNKET